MSSAGRIPSCPLDMEEIAYIGNALGVMNIVSRIEPERRKSDEAFQEYAHSTLDPSPENRLPSSVVIGDIYKSVCMCGSPDKYVESIRRRQWLSAETTSVILPSSRSDEDGSVRLGEH